MQIITKVTTNISLDADLKQASQELYTDLGMDLTTAVTIFLKQSIRVQKLPFAVTRENRYYILEMNQMNTTK